MATELKTVWLVSFLSERYGLPTPIQVKFIGPGANRNYLIQAAEQKYVLRVYCENDYYPRRK